MSFSPPRSAGVALHVTSLPGGRLGACAHEWIDWLAQAGQSWWQVLPLGPPDRHGSPYKSSSAFAAWRGLLAEPDATVEPHEREAFREAHGFWAARLPTRLLDDQVRFAREWAALREHARRRGVGIIGDVPIYVAQGSIDHRTWPELFRADVVAGAPPDTFSDRGQHWGNPMYDWPALQRRGYRWWIERFRRTTELFDAARVDHFRGFVAGWAIPAGTRDARTGGWRRGPGAALFRAVERELGALALIAEDLGEITPPVVALRRELELPGMVVLQFAFDPADPHGPHRLEHHRGDAVAYTSTHDTDTLAGWWASLPPARRAEALAAGVDAADPVWSLIRLWFGSPAPLVMTQLQDVLGLGSEARMNFPGRATGAWRWRLEPRQLTAALAARLRAVTAETGRLAG